MRAVNLLPDQGAQGGALSQVSTNTVGIAGASLLAIVSVIIGFLFLQSHNKVSDRQETLTAMQQKTVKLQNTIAKSATAAGSDQTRVAAFTTASGARIPWDDLLDDISRVLPSGSWLSSLNMSVGTAAPTTSPTGAPEAPAPLPTSFSVSGFAFSQNEVARVMQRLALVPALQGVTLQSSTLSPVGETKAFQFMISANVLAPAVES